MNAVEIEAALSDIAAEPFEPSEFPFSFLAAFGNKATTITRLRKGDSNASDVPGGVLQRNNIHIAVAPKGQVGLTLNTLRSSEKTTQAKAKFILATDGVTLEAEDLASGETIAGDYARFPDHFGFFLPLAGITTVQEIKDNPVDVRATGRLNKLYVELLQENEDWATAEKRPAMNHFMARLIFCFFAEDTDIFPGEGLFTTTVEQMSERDGSNTHEVVATLFRAMNVRPGDRDQAQLPNWAQKFPYVNGGLFGGETDVPRFSRTARAYLFQAGQLDWKAINPDIFGSMIQAVADDEERGALGMHYTSVPNILKVLNPLFLDELREQLEAAGDSKIKLLNLRKRMARIRVFDPACGSGNFLVIAYKQMREIEAEVNRRRGELNRASSIPLTNFRGIELRHFPAEIARLALIIAEFQCNVLYRGPQEALKFVLPLDSRNWITCGNALRLNWQEVCPPPGAEVQAKLESDDLFSTPLEQPEIGFAHEGGETFICGNPPFKGARKQSKSQKADLAHVFGGGNAFKDCDYVTGWYLKASQYSNVTPTDFAFVSTNSISRGEQVEHLWSRLYQNGDTIKFCHTQFKWQNNAQHNAGVWCVIIGLTRSRPTIRRVYEDDTVRGVPSISPYLIPGEEQFIEKARQPISHGFPRLVSGNMARDGGNLILRDEEREALLKAHPKAAGLLRPLIGTTEIRQGTRRWCVWVEDHQIEEAMAIPPIAARIDQTREFRLSSKAKTTIAYARVPHRFAQRCHQDRSSIVVPKNTTEGLPYLTPDYVTRNTITTDLAFVAFTEQTWVFAVLSSTLHRVWAEAISGGLGSGIRYSSVITYNAFPVPRLTSQQRTDLSQCAEDILLAREAHYPAPIADLYGSDSMPHDLRLAHEKNDEVLERIYIGRRFRNDTERLEKLFEIYTTMKTPKSSNARTN